MLPIFTEKSTCGIVFFAKMAIAKFFLVALLFATAVLAQTETKRVIDEFTVGQDTFVIVTIGDGSTQSRSGTVPTPTPPTSTAPVLAALTSTPTSPTGSTSPEGVTSSSRLSSLSILAAALAPPSSLSPTPLSPPISSWTSRTSRDHATSPTLAPCSSSLTSPTTSI